MADNFFKIDRGVTLAPQSSVASPQSGDVYYDSTRNTYVYRNNGASVDLQSRSDVGTASSLTSTNFTASVVQSSLIKLTGSTVSNIHGLTSSSDAKTVVLYNGSSAVVTIKNASGTEATAGNRILTSTGADVNLNPSEAIKLAYDSTQARWIVVSSPGSGASSGSGKNYLSTYKNNPGNGNLESGSTTGWSLGVTGALTNGLPSATPTFGSGASGNLSLSVVSSGQLAGSYSMSYASSAATTVGNMVASDAFTIDLEDQAKVLTWKIYYKAQTNPGNANWSGTSSNSFGVAVYDVTNSAWLPTTASFGMTQSSGVGIASGTVQTASNASQLRLVVYNINATTGAVTLYFDDMSFGPQTAPLGAVATDWIAYTPTITGFGTTTSVAFYSRRVGDNLEVKGSFGSGTSTATNAIITIGYNGGNANVSVDTAKVGASTAVGAYAVGATAQLNSMILAPTTSTTNVKMGKSSASTNPLAAANADTIAGSGQSVQVFFTVPIVGWSSNVQMSNDTDTRVVAFRADSVSGNLTTTATTINFGAATTDTHGGWNGSTTYTVPVTGIYDIEGYHGDSTNSAYTGTTTTTIRKNGATVVSTLMFLSSAVGMSNIVSTPFSLKGFKLNAGDTIDIQAFANNAYTSTAYVYAALSIVMRSGPAVVAATESVNASYTDSASAAIGTSFATYTYATKNFDSHNAYSSGTYTIPVSGKYRISAKMTTNGVGLTTTQNFQLAINRNGTQRLVNVCNGNGGGGSVTQSTSVSGTLSCSAGDTITISAKCDVATTALATAAYNDFSIERVGN